MLRIDTHGVGRIERIVVEGRLTGRWTDELELVADGVSSTDAHPPILDVAGLDFADARGVALLRVLIARGFSLVGGSPFIRTLVWGDNDHAAH